MYVLINCKLQSTGHIFEIRLCFRCFHHLERSLRWMCDWRQLLRPKHHFLPGEENHYKGQVCDKEPNHVFCVTTSIIRCNEDLLREETCKTKMTS